jgi:hypothetical protein
VLVVPPKLVGGLTRDREDAGAGVPINVLPEGPLSIPRPAGRLFAFAIRLVRRSEQQREHSAGGCDLNQAGV